MPTEHEIWLDARKGRITATRASAIVSQRAGYASYGSPASVYLEVKHGIDPDAINPMFEKNGAKTEAYFPTAAAKRFPFLKFQRATEFDPNTVPTGGLFVDPKCDWKATSIDWIATLDEKQFMHVSMRDRTLEISRITDPILIQLFELAVRGFAILFEIKSVNRFGKAKWYPGGELTIPKNYEVQGYWERMVLESCGHNIGAVVVAVDFEDQFEFEYLPIDWSEKVAQTIDVHIVNWYNKYITGNDVPEIDPNDPSVDKLLDVMYPMNADRVKREATAEERILMQSYLALTKQIKPLEDAKEATKVELKTLIGSAYIIECNDCKSTLSEPGKKVDKEAVINDLIDQINTFKKAIQLLIGCGITSANNGEMVVELDEYTKLPTPEEIIAEHTSPGTRVLRVTAIDPNKAKGKKS